MPDLPPGPYRIFYDGVHTVTFDNYENAHRYVYNLHSTVVTVLDSQGQSVTFTGRPKTEAAQRVAALMEKHRCSRSQAVRLYHQERKTGEPLPLRRPGRPLTEVGQRIAAIMAEKGCSRATARKLYAREVAGESAPEARGPGRPPSAATARVRAIMAERGVSYNTAYQQMLRENAQRVLRGPGRPNAHERAVVQVMEKAGVGEPEARRLLADALAAAVPEHLAEAERLALAVRVAVAATQSFIPGVT